MKIVAVQGSRCPCNDSESVENEDPAQPSGKNQSYSPLKEKRGSLVPISFTDCTVKAKFTDRSGTKSIK